MRRTLDLALALLAGVLMTCGAARAADISVSASAVSLSAGAKATVRVSNASGTVRATTSSSAIATVTYASPNLTITGVAAGREAGEKLKIGAAMVSEMLDVVPE